MYQSAKGQMEDKDKQSTPLGKSFDIIYQSLAEP